MTRLRAWWSGSDVLGHLRLEAEFILAEDLERRLTPALRPVEQTRSHNDLVAEDVLFINCQSHNSLSKRLV